MTTTSFESRSTSTLGHAGDGTDLLLDRGFAVAAGHAGDGECERVHDFTNRSMALDASVMIRSDSVMVVRLHGVGHAVPEVVVEELHCDALQRPRRRRHLGQDVDAVGVFVDHPLETPDLTLDPLQPREDGGLVVVIPGRCHAAIATGEPAEYPTGVPLRTACRFQRRAAARRGSRAPAARSPRRAVR